MSSLGVSGTGTVRSRNTTSHSSCLLDWCGGTVKQHLCVESFSWHLLTAITFSINYRWLIYKLRYFFLTILVLQSPDVINLILINQRINLGWYTKNFPKKWNFKSSPEVNHSTKQNGSSSSIWYKLKDAFSSPAKSKSLECCFQNGKISF